ncbi:MAG: LamG domain-containing protein [Deltaproteobacteria bacterium]|nr:LamG domain-containing protein [Deltaproteobacteria bacterium]
MSARVAASSLVFLLGCGRVGFTATDAPRSIDALQPDASTRDAPSVSEMDATADDASSMDAAILVDATTFDTSIDGGPIDGATTDVAMPDALDPDAFAAPDAGADAFSVPDAPPGCGALRLYYRFEEASGPVIDESGCGNDGTPSDVLTGQPGANGSAYVFNRAGVLNAHVLVPDSPSLSAFSQLTVEAWVRHRGGMFQTIVGQGDLVDGDPFTFHTFTDRDPSLTLPNHPTCTGSASYRSSTPLPVDSWVHVAFSYDATTGVLVHYRDGNEVLRENTPYASRVLCDNAEALLVGASRPDGTWGWQGLLDELRIWGVIRTEAEICTDAGGVLSGAICAFP